MEYTALGKSGIKISKICLGCMTFGEDKDKPWLLNQEQADEMVKRALDLGINFFDTANCYNFGTSEEYLGKSLKKFTKREDVVIATKVRLNEGGLSREAILREVEGSLKRLQIDYLDLYIIHRWDYDTPIEETMGTLNELVQSGKVRALGCSAVFSYQFYKAQECARQHGWATFVSIQNHYNLVYREEEREMIQLLEEEGMVMTPYSPLAGGRLARLWEADTARYKFDEFAKTKYEHDREIDLPVVQRVKEIADKHQVSMGQVSMAWLLSKPLMAAPIVGVTKIQHLEDACKAVNLKLSDEEIKYLEELYVPHNVVGAVKKEFNVKF
uniref:Dehydrogenase n=1 Tax=Piromyces sp. TaxID=45796 RepID=A0A2S1TZ18_PIRSP|nr:dehydrogenase [Piromyces sp.]